MKAFVIPYPPSRNGAAIRKPIFTVLASILCVPVAIAATPSDVAAPVRQFIDAFNRGDTKTAYATYASGDIAIVDEFAPHSWTGPHAPQDWAAEYDKHAQATGVTDGKVTYGRPSRTEMEGKFAYLTLPSVYLYKEHGKPMQEEGQIVAVLTLEANGWKIRAWTWSGVKPHPAK